MDDEEKQENKQRSVDELVVQQLMSTTDGREYMWNKLQECDVFENIFENDPIMSAYRSGKRAAGLLLEQDLKAYAPGSYIKMLQENM